jgi:hypothetical protein
MMSVETIEIILIPILILLPFTVIDAGMGLLFLTLSVQAVEQDALFRSLTFLFGSFLLVCSLYAGAAAFSAVLHWLIPFMQ